MKHRYFTFRKTRLILLRCGAAQPSPCLLYTSYIGPEHQSPIITTFCYPVGVSFRFPEFYQYIKARGYAIYPGKLTERDTFRIGTIGEVYEEDIEKLAAIIYDFLRERKGETA